MAYSTSNPPALVSQRVGDSGGAIWMYKDGDAVSTVGFSGYVTDAKDLGMKAGDRVIHVDETNGVSTDLSVTAHTAGTASGATCSAIEPVGETSIALSSAGTGTILIGDSIEFGTDPDVFYTVTEGDTDVSDGGNITITPALATATAVGTTITVRPSADVLKLSAGKMAKVETLDQARTIKAEESGTNFFVANATGFAITLPAPVAGLEYTFTTALAISSGNHTIVTNGGADIINGSAEVAGAVVVAGLEDTITIVGTAETLGDFVHLVSDGTYWFVNAIGAVTASITFTAT